MIIPLLVVIAVELIWAPWGAFITTTYEQMDYSTASGAAQADAVYFFGMFVVAALVDFLVVNVLIGTLKNGSFNKYQQILIGLFCTSMAVHIIGMIGFFAEGALLVQVYDYIGMGIRALEAAVFIGYGLDRLLIRGRHSIIDSSKGSR